MPAPKVTLAWCGWSPAPAGGGRIPGPFFQGGAGASASAQDLSNALSAVFGDKTAIAAALESCGLSPDIRGSGCPSGICGLPKQCGVGISYPRFLCAEKLNLHIVRAAHVHQIAVSEEENHCISTA